MLCSYFVVLLNKTAPFEFYTYCIPEQSFPIADIELRGGNVCTSSTFLGLFSYKYILKELIHKNNLRVNSKIS